MKFLDLCKLFRIDAGMTGKGPESVTATDDQTQRIAQYVRNGWIHVQSEHLSQDYDKPCWRFLWRREEFDTPQESASVYSGEITGHNARCLIPGTAWLYLKTAGASTRQMLRLLHWRDHQNLIKDMELQDRQTPSFLVMRPDNTIVLLPRPDDLYTLDVEFYRIAQVLTQNEDELLCPDPLAEKLTVYAALMDYGREEGASEIIQVAPAQYAEKLSLLEWNQLDTLADMRVEVC